MNESNLTIDQIKDMLNDKSYDLTQDIYYKIGVEYIKQFSEACKNCPNNPNNGGIGICNCILGNSNIY